MSSFGITPKNFVDITGRRFHRLQVLSRAGRDSHGRATWNCVCDCGNTCVVAGYLLRNNGTKSCGCLHDEKARERAIARNATHRKSNSRLYPIWHSMKQRCTYPHHPAWKYYGGRGITVCDEWLHSFEAFYRWAYENGYRDDAQKWECTLDRIDNNGNYCPENCRWVDMKTQVANQRKDRSRRNEKGQYAKYDTR